MMTESSLAHPPPFPFTRCKPLLQPTQEDELPLVFLTAFPVPLFCMMNRLLTLSLKKKPAKILPESFLSLITLVSFITLA